MKENLNGKIGALLKQKRIERGLSLQGVADILGIHRTSVYYWETGRNTISASDMLDYCKVLGVNPNDFIKELFE